MCFVIKFLYEICIFTCLTFDPFSPKPDRIRIRIKFVIFPIRLDQNFLNPNRLIEVR